MRESALTLTLHAERISAFPCEHGALDSQCPMRYTPLRVGGVDSDDSEAFRAEMFTGILVGYRLVAAAIVSHKRPHILESEFCGAQPVRAATGNERDSRELSGKHNYDMMVLA